MKTFLSLLALAVAAASAQDGSTTPGECLPIQGVCEINLETLVEVSFYDVLDTLGCELECASLSICNFYSIFQDPYDETLNKCLLFESCNIIEPCDECTTYPDDPEQCFDGNTEGESCEATKENVVDILYFDEDDDFSCEQKCLDILDCHFWSQFFIETFDSAINKCFLFRDCENTEPCVDCITGESP